MELRVHNLELRVLKNGIFCPWSSPRIFSSKSWKYFVIDDIIFFFLKIWKISIHPSWFFFFLKGKKKDFLFLFFGVDWVDSTTHVVKQKGGPNFGPHSLSFPPFFAFIFSFFLLPLLLLFTSFFHLDFLLHYTISSLKKLLS